jgi:RES domain-containing protein
LNATAWRIAVEAPQYAADDMSGTGARLSGGRWNSCGVAMVYASSNIALAALETLTGKQAVGLPFNRYLVQLSIPEAVWERRRILNHRPGGWDALPCGLASKREGDSWIRAGESAVMIVPSVIIPDELNVLVNPRHPDAAAIAATTVKRFAYDPRFF